MYTIDRGISFSTQWSYCLGRLYSRAIIDTQVSSHCFENVTEAVVVPFRVYK